MGQRGWCFGFRPRARIAIVWLPLLTSEVVAARATTCACPWITFPTSRMQWMKLLALLCALLSLPQPAWSGDAQPPQIIFGTNFALLCIGGSHEVALVPSSGAVLCPWVPVDPAGDALPHLLCITRAHVIAAAAAVAGLVRVHPQSKARCLVKSSTAATNVAVN